MRLKDFLCIIPCEHCGKYGCYVAKCPHLVVEKKTFNHKIDKRANLESADCTFNALKKSHADVVYKTKLNTN